MRILLLTTHLRMGGVPVYVVTLAAALKRHGHNVYTASSGGELTERLDREGITRIELDIDTKSELHPKVFIAICRLLRFIKENNIEIIHANTRVSQVIAQALSVLTAARHVCTCHGFFKPRIGRRLFGCWGSKVIAISAPVKEHLINDFKLRQSRIELIHNGIDVEAFGRGYPDAQKSRFKSELGLKRNGPVVGIISRLSPVKGHKFLIAAMARVIERFKDAELLIVGDGGEEGRLRALARELGISEAVIFEKSILDTARALAVMDVFVLPSINEGLGLVILEALACGTPVVASSVGGISSIVKDNATGLLVRPKDTSGLAGAVMRLLEDKALARRLASEGQKFVRENFALEDMVSRVEGVYKEVMCVRG